MTPHRRPLPRTKTRRWPVRLVAGLACTVLCLVAPAAFAQPDDVLIRLQAAHEQFVAQQAALTADELRFAAGTTTGDRLRRDAAAAALALAEALETAIEVEALPESSRAIAWDDALTARQIAGALLLDVGDCIEAHRVLDALRAMPELASRPAVAAATEARYNDAEACLATDPSDALPPIVATQAEPRPARAAPVMLSASAGASLAVAAGLWVRAGNAGGDARRERSSSSRSLAAYEDARTTAQRAQRGAATTTVLGVALAAAALVAWTPQRRDASSGATLGAALTPRTASVSVQW